MWTLRQFVKASFPVTQLHHDSTPADDKYHGTVHLQQGTTIQISADPEDVIEVTDPDGQSFEIIRRDTSTNFISILVPGYGFGWVERAASREKSMRLSSSRQKYNSSSSAVCRVDVGEALHRDQHLEHMLVWLPHVGSRLKVLRGTTYELTETLLASILTYCPNLEVLDVMGMTVNSIQPILDAVLRKDCRLTSLTMTNWRINDENSVPTLLVMLGYPHYRIARQLQRLELSSAQSSRTVLAALVYALLYNRRLHYVKAYLLPKHIQTFYLMADKFQLFHQDRFVGLPLSVEVLNAHS